MTHSFEALGTKWWITVFDESDTLDVAFGDIERFVTDFEATYSRFKPDSLISKLNRDRTLEHPDEEFRALLIYGKQLYLRTDTHFNILTGHILEARGYDANYSFAENTSESLTPGNPVTDLLISSEQVELLHGNIDIGGFGKGYLIDLIANELEQTHGFKYFHINGGGDMFATSNHEKPLQLLLEHPTEPKKYIGKLPLMHSGFASSSPFKRIWGPDGSLNHVVAQTHVHKIASFVTASTTADADVLATTALLMDTDEFLKMAQSQQAQAGRFDPETGKVWHTKDFAFSNT